jgi:hypothetical protein
MGVALDIQDATSLNWGMAYPGVRSESPGEIQIRGKLPPWWAAVEPRIRDLLSLRPNWDPRGAGTLSHEDLIDAVRFLARVMRDDTAAPWIGPLASGGVELAWRSGEVEVEAVFDRAREERQLLVSVGGVEWEALIDDAESLFATVVERLDAGGPVVP